MDGWKNITNMKSQILKIAGVKSEKEFYKKYPTEAAFFKAHPEAKTKLKKAQIGTLVGGAYPTQSVSKPAAYVDFQSIYNNSDKLVTGSTQAERNKAAYEQAILEASGKGGGGGQAGGASGIMGGISSALGMFGGEGEDVEDMDVDRYGGSIPKAYSGFTTPDWFQNATTTAQSTYPPNVGQTYGINAQTTPAPRFASPSLPGAPQSYGPGGTNYGGPSTYPAPPANDFSQGGNGLFKPAGYPQEGYKPNSYSGYQGEVNRGPSGLTKALEALGPAAGPLTSIAQGYDMLREGRAKEKEAKQANEVSKVALVASATREEQSKRKYVRPEDIQNTGEEFFPIYGVGTNALTRNGGAIHKAQSGSRIGGNPTEIQNTYSDGYDIYTDSGYDPADKYREGGYIPVAQSGFSDFFSGNADPSAYGQAGNVATNIGYSFMGGENGGGRIGSTLGSTAGNLIGGPVGGAIGGFVGGIAGNALDTTGKNIASLNKSTENNTKAMSINSASQLLHGRHTAVSRNGGYMNPEYNPQVIAMFGDHNAQDFADYAHKDVARAGGHLKQYTPPSERAMETYAMGGQLKTHWGGEAETMSYNPYSAGSGEMVKFNGQSHTKSDAKGNTGIGITYGENPVEVEGGEPMFEMSSGGEIDPQTGEAETTGVVFGNMKIDKKVAGQLKDPELMAIADKHNGKRFSNVGLSYATEENKIGKFIDKNVNLIDSLDVKTSTDKAKEMALRFNIEGADAKLRNIANEKIILANYQNSINDAKDELSEVIGQNLSAEDLAKGYTKLDRDPVTKDAKWGGNIAKKAKSGTTTKDADPPVSFKSASEAAAKGYRKDADGKYRRTIKKFNSIETENKAADALGYVPSGQKQSNSGLWGKVTPDNFEEAKIANPWFDWNNFNPKRKADVENYQMAFNDRAKELGSGKRVQVDGDFGEQTVSARIDESKAYAPDNTEETLTATVDEPAPTPEVEEKRKFPWLPLANQVLKYFTPSDQTALDNQQLYPEWFAMATNQVEPVPAQGYQPDLIVPYDISLQAQRNAVVSGQRALSKQVGYNPAAQANIAPTAYNAINEVNEKEFIANQGLKNQVYTGNVNTMNEAKKINLGIFADQWNKQSQAKSNTKATTQAALNSIADKYAKHKLENRTLSIYENMYNYRFGKSGRAQNWNGLQFFDTMIGGGKNRVADKSMPGYKATSYDKDGNVLTWKKLTSKEDDDADSIDDDTTTMPAKNGKSVKKDNKNSSILRAFKNL